MSDRMSKKVLQFADLQRKDIENEHKQVRHSMPRSRLFHLREQEEEYDDGNFLLYFPIVFESTVTTNALSFVLLPYIPDLICIKFLSYFDIQYN